MRLPGAFPTQVRTGTDDAGRRSHPTQAAAVDGGLFQGYYNLNSHKDQGGAMRIGIAQAKARLSELVNRVAFGGESVILESRGKPKAALVSVEDLTRVQDALSRRLAKSQRLLALVRADQMRQVLQSRSLTSSVEELQRLRRERIDAIS